MPELPEVETTVRQIRPQILGRTISSSAVSWARTLVDGRPADLDAAVRSARIDGVRRRAKLIVIDVERRDQKRGHVVIHLRMTGRLLVMNVSDERSRWERARFLLDNGTALTFVDPRKFGRVWWTEDLPKLTGALGPEPLGRVFTPQWLIRELRSRRRRLKPLLLDQTFLAGLGNIYVDESLHRARLHPRLVSDRVSLDGARRLHAAIRATLQAAIRREGSSFDTFYRTPDGRRGSYQDHFRVYGRAGEACPACGGRVHRILVGQRGTHFCPRCQRLR
ncbi:MAG: bifunctional DNA-formamidopyrimidine glycosylase/DNA-(apurinic or apyrimidinic site) lyase [Vicinamibacteria bacterium]|jgi:formamidopyrimidine-DNA glycosylase|nr:bifunctional DNA-formamidopyrimidine glycosylase/DNA-(apurinic or apyrimidinic site) lyase [Vicinamibacteria bacterium]